MVRTNGMLPYNCYHATNATNACIGCVPTVPTPLYRCVGQFANTAFELGAVLEGGTREEEVHLDCLRISAENEWNACTVGIGAWCALFP
jgi:hypothetical protein